VFAEPSVLRELRGEVPGESRASLASLRRAARARKGRGTRIGLAAGETHDAILRIARDPDVAPGSVNVLEVAQIDEVKQRVVGGLWIIVRAV
jgi:hypothetical protein